MKKFVLTFILLLLSLNISFSATVIDNVETYLYGFTYASQDENTRLNRIEKTIYGSTTNKTAVQKIAKIKSDLAADLIGKEITPVEDTFMEQEDSIANIDTKIPQGSNIDYPIINEMEKQVFNQVYKTNDVNGRLAKLETKTFGKTYSDDLNSRVDRLSAKLKPKSMMNNTLAQSSDSFFDEEQLNLSRNQRIPAYGLDNGLNDDFDYDSYNSRNIYPPQGGNQNYFSPSSSSNLSSVEKALFKQIYATDAMPNRLARLEVSMFGTTFDNDKQEVRLNRISSAFNASKSSKKYDSNKFSQNMTTAIQIGTMILMVLACIL